MTLFFSVYCIAYCFSMNSAGQETIPGPILHPPSSMLPTICFWKPIRHLCKGGKLEQRHLQLSDEASLSDRVSLSFFLLQDQIAALYITKELPAWPASLSLPSDAASLFLRQGWRVFCYWKRRTWIKDITYRAEIAVVTLRIRQHSMTSISCVWKIYVLPHHLFYLFIAFKACVTG